LKGEEGKNVTARARGPLPGIIKSAKKEWVIKSNCLPEGEKSNNVDRQKEAETWFRVMFFRWGRNDEDPRMLIKEGARGLKQK